jgi:K+-transporting ATPase ATPase A chain
MKGAPPRCTACWGRWSGASTAWRGRPEREQGWRAYALHMLALQVALTLFTYACCGSGRAADEPARWRALGRWRDEHRHRFVTNTNWQWYAGESVLSNLSQMGADHSQLPVGGHRHRGGLRAVSRLCAHEAATVGNFWADCTRITLYLLLPACVLYALFLVASGVPQTFASLVEAHTLEGAKQAIVLGPVAARKRSRCWAPMAAASSTPIRPIRLKTPRR